MKKLKNEEFCGSIPLHVINHIQAYGFLLVVCRDHLQILQASENFAEALSVPMEELLGAQLNERLPEEQIKKIMEGVTRQFSTKLPLKMTFKAGENEHRFDALIHFGEQYLLIELESIMEEERTFMDRFGEFKFITGKLSNTTDVQELTDRVAVEVKHITGFDKVMVYRFDEMYNGTVVSEAMEEGMDSYLGLCFPSSDIPRQAREMYMKTAYRFIPDAGYVPVKLQPVINPQTHTFTDLTTCNLRGVAGVHLEYLRNMNVSASMSLRLVHEGRLWGLIACHHRVPKQLSYDSCVLLEILSEFISSRITLAEKESEHLRVSQLLELNTKIMEQANIKQDLVEGLLANENLLKVLNVDGIVIAKEKKLHTMGITPSSVDMQDIVRWVQKGQFQGIYTDEAFPKTFERAKRIKDCCSGLVVIPLSLSQEYYIIGFRKEVIQHVHWGGNPNEAVTFEEDRSKYHPRNSFQMWKETVSERSIPFDAAEKKAAEVLRQWLLEFIINRNH